MISVVTPTYNCAKYIERSYECLRRQTFSDWEWVVVDDGSSDETEELLKNIVGGDSRVNYYRLANNRGRGYARNYALERCTGSVIAIWDIDDLYTKSRLEKIYQAIKSGHDFFCSYALVVDNQSNLKGARHFPNRHNNFMPSFVHATLAFKSSLKSAVSYDSTMPAGEDLRVMLNLSNNYRGYYCEDYLFIYFEDREVNLKKATDANLSQFRSVLEAMDKKIIKVNRKEKFSFLLKKVVKISILRLFLLSPSFYLKSVNFRSYEFIITKKLTHEHLQLLSDANVK